MVVNCLHLYHSSAQTYDFFPSEFYLLFMEISLPYIIGLWKWLDLVTVNRKKVHSLTDFQIYPLDEFIHSWAGLVASLFSCSVVESPSLSRIKTSIFSLTQSTWANLGLGHLQWKGGNFQLFSLSWLYPHSRAIGLGPSGWGGGRARREKSVEVSYVMGTVVSWHWIWTVHNH